MIRVNLLPLAERRPKWRVRRIYCAVVLLVMLAFFSVYGFNAAQGYYIETQMQFTRDELESLRPVQQKMLAANAKQQNINQKQLVINNLTREQTPWYPVLAELGAKTPPQLWLMDLVIDKSTIKIVGMAKSYPDLAVFMQMLDKDEILTQPVLIKAERDSALPATKFEMTVKIRGR